MTPLTVLFTLTFRTCFGRIFTWSTNQSNSRTAVVFIDKQITHFVSVYLKNRSSHGRNTLWASTKCGYMYRIYTCSQIFVSAIAWTSWKSIEFSLVLPSVCLLAGMCPSVVFIVCSYWKKHHPEFCLWLFCSQRQHVLWFLRVQICRLRHRGCPSVPVGRVLSCTELFMSI